MEKERAGDGKKGEKNEERGEKNSRRREVTSESSGGNTQKLEWAPNTGTWKTNLRYSGNWGHWNLQRKRTKTTGQEKEIH